MKLSLLALAVALLAVLTLLPIWRYEAWWVRGQDFPRLQYAVLALLLLVIEWIALERDSARWWLLCGITLACQSRPTAGGRRGSTCWTATIRTR